MGKEFASKMDYRFVFSSFSHQWEEVRGEKSKCQTVSEGDYGFSAEVIRWTFLNPGLKSEGSSQVTGPFVRFSSHRLMCVLEKELSPL